MVWQFVQQHTVWMQNSLLSSLQEPLVFMPGSFLGNYVFHLLSSRDIFGCMSSKISRNRFSQRGCHLPLPTAQIVLGSVEFPGAGLEVQLSLKRDSLTLRGRFLCAPGVWVGKAPQPFILLSFLFPYLNTKTKGLEGPCIRVIFLSNESTWYGIKQLEPLSALLMQALWGSVPHCGFLASYWKEFELDLHRV